MIEINKHIYITWIQAMLVAFLMILAFSPAYGEDEFGEYVTYAQGIRIKCTSNFFEVASYNYENRPTASIVEKGEGETIYFGFKKREINCLLGKHKLKVAFITDRPREKGMCGGGPGSKVSIWIDNQLVMKQQLFNNECFESISNVSFEQKNGNNFIFKICGHKYMPGYPINNDCFSFGEKAFWSLPKPFQMDTISKFKKEGYPSSKEDN